MVKRVRKRRRKVVREETEEKVAEIDEKATENPEGLRENSPERGDDGSWVKEEGEVVARKNERGRKSRVSETEAKVAETDEKAPENHEGLRENSRPGEERGFSGFLEEEETGCAGKKRQDEEKVPETEEKAPESHEVLREKSPPGEEDGFPEKEKVVVKNKRLRGRKRKQKEEVEEIGDFKTKTVVENDVDRVPEKKRGRKGGKKEDVSNSLDFVDKDGQEEDGVLTIKSRLRTPRHVEYTLDCYLGEEDQDDLGKPRRKVRRKRKNPEDQKLPTEEGRGNCEPNVEDEEISAGNHGRQVRRKGKAEGRAGGGSDGGGVENVGVKVYKRRGNGRKKAKVNGVRDLESEGDKGKGGVGGENEIKVGGRVLKKRVLNVLNQEKPKINRLNKVRSFPFCKFLLY